MTWAAVTNVISQEIIVLYISAIFWTLGYDTIYGAQDMSEDEIIGLKSTSIKFKNNIKLFLGISYLITMILMTYLFNTYIGTKFFYFFVNYIFRKSLLSSIYV